MIRLLCQKQSDLGLYCLSRPFWQVTNVQNFRTFTVADLAGKPARVLHIYLVRCTKVKILCMLIYY